MRAAALVALLLAGCAGAPGGTPSSTPLAATSPSATPTAVASSLQPTASPTASASPNTVYTAEDEAIAKLIRAGADEAIPQLEVLNDMDPSKLEDLFLPLGVWITGQKAGVESYAPSSCTTAALTLFIDGIDRYDAIRKRFLAWRDWGAHGHAFPFAAPRQAARSFEDALVALESSCPGPSATTN